MAMVVAGNSNAVLANPAAVLAKVSKALVACGPTRFCYGRTVHFVLTCPVFSHSFDPFSAAQSSEAGSANAAASLHSGSAGISSGGNALQQLLEREIGSLSSTAAASVPVMISEGPPSPWDFDAGEATRKNIPEQVRSISAHFLSHALSHTRACTRIFWHTHHVRPILFF